MDAAATTTAVPAPARFNPILPYTAVLRTDLRQTLQSWVFRLWFLISLVAALGYGLYKFGIHREVGLVQSASEQTGVLLRAVSMVTLAFVSLVGVIAIGGERCSLAASVLSRVISRYQYFAAKWHARTLMVLAGFAVLSTLVLTAYHFLLEPDITLNGGIAATIVALSGLAAMVAWGTTVGALSKGTVIGVVIFWVILFGALFLLSFVPEPFPSPNQLISQMRSTLRGNFEWMKIAKIAGIFFGLALLGGTVGLIGFGKKDV